MVSQRELDDEEEDDYSYYDEGEDEEDYIHQTLSGEEDFEDL
jgi:hypothetical protein